MSKPNRVSPPSGKAAKDAEAKAALGSKGGQSDKSESGFIAAEKADTQSGKKQFRNNPPEPDEKS